MALSIITSHTLPPLSSSAGGDSISIPLYSLNLDTLPRAMFRKASNLFSKKPLHSLAIQPSTVDTLSISSNSPPFLKKPIKKRSFADLLARAPTGANESSSSLSSLSIEMSSSSSPSPNLKKAKPKKSLPRLRSRKRSLPKWENNRSTRDQIPDTGSSQSSYLQGYSSISTENDLQTLELLRLLYPSACPTFYQYSRVGAPQNILDLGCGCRGSWVFEAANYWHSQGTKVTGFDLEEPIYWNADSAACDNVRFVQGNFLYGLPFEDDSFDFVRIANLNLSIPRDRWPDVLAETYRVLRPGGVVEVIEEDLLWPYLEALPTSPVKPTSSHTSTFYNNSNNNHNNNSDGDDQLLTKDLHSNAYGQYDRSVVSSNALEELFEKMIWFKHGIHPHPHRYIENCIADTFAIDNNGPQVFRVALPPLGFEPYERETRGERNGFGSLFTEKKRPDDFPNEYSIVGDSPCTSPSLPETITSKAARRLLGSSVPTRLGEKRDIQGLLLYPEMQGPPFTGKFAFMDASQMEMSICRNMHILLDCKSSLEEFIWELQDGNDAMSPEDISSALWDYECFRRTRFNLPHTPRDLEMRENAQENVKASGSSRISTDSAESGLSFRRESVARKRSSMDVALPDRDQLTCVRVIRIFHGRKFGW